MCNQGLLAFLVVTPSRAGYQLTGIFLLQVWIFARWPTSWLAPCVGSPSRLFLIFFWVLITRQYEKKWGVEWDQTGKGGGSLLPLYSNFRAFTKQGLLKSCLLLCDFFQLAGVCCVRVYSKYRLILLLATRLIY